MAHNHTPDSEARVLAQRFVKLFRELAMISNKQGLSEIIDEELNVNQIRALQLIRQEPGLTQKEVAESLEIKPSSASVAIRRLEEMQYLERHPDPDDGRVMRLYLGRRGQELVHRIEELQASIMIDLLGSLPLNEQRLVIDALERAVAAKLRVANRQQSHEGV
jgi:DNA-binding MarR family transcriptional regulator